MPCCGMYVAEPLVSSRGAGIAIFLWKVVYCIVFKVWVVSHHEGGIIETILPRFGFAPWSSVVVLSLSSKEEFIDSYLKY